MKNTGRDFLDPTQRAASHLNALIDDASKEDNPEITVVDETLRRQEEEPVTPTVNEIEYGSGEVGSEETVPEIHIDEAYNEAQIIAVDNNRERSRLLVITTDASVAEVGSLTYKRFTDMRAMFLEVHIILLDYRSPHHEENLVVRLFDSVWLYATKSTSWWTLGYDGYRLAEKQLVFSGGFRADIIVAEDPFVAGCVAVLLGKKHDRPVQVHAYDDFFDEAFVSAQEHPMLYTWIIDYVFSHVKSIRTKTEFQRTELLSRYSKYGITVELLPSYYDLDAWRDLAPSVNLKERYPQFKFIMLHISSMRAVSHTDEVLNGVAPILRRYPTIGLVVLGNGPLRSHLEHQVIALGLQNQVEFEPMPTEVVSHMKSANLLLHVSDDGAEDDIVLAAATVRLPMVANASGLAGKLFVDGESASLCASTDSTCITQNINRLLNENQTRTHFAISAFETVFERVEQDYGGFLGSYRDSIERSVVEHS